VADRQTDGRTDRITAASTSLALRPVVCENCTTYYYQLTIYNQYLHSGTEQAKCRQCCCKCNNFTWMHL